jgi:hypothetical protein
MCIIINITKETQVLEPLQYNFAGTANLAYMLLNFRINNSIEFNAVAVNTVINTGLTS